MPSGLVALLDDVAAITKMAAASLDDVAAAAGRAGTKAAGVVIDDAAVTPRYVVGLTPDRELPIIAKIARGSLFNKLVILLPIALALKAFAPWAITPLLMLGGAFLCYEAAHKIIHALQGHHESEEELADVADAAELEQRQVSGAVRTDFILSAEIMAIALADINSGSFWMQAAVLAAVAIAITVGVYGVVALIVKMDDIGLHMAKGSTGAGRSIGRGLVIMMPKLMSALALIGTAAMVWVGGGIIVHGLHEFHLTPIPGWVDGASAAAGAALPAIKGVAEWVAHAIGSAIVGIIVGGIIVFALQLIPGKKAAH